MFFYKEKDPDPELRFGDIVKGFVITVPDMPPTVSGLQPQEYKVTVFQPPLAVVLTPCCSIGEKTLMLTPLVEIRRDWIKNPYFCDDFTNINRPMLPQQAVVPQDWEKMSDEEKRRRLDRSKPGGAYVHLDLFVYAPHPHLGTYEKTLYGEKKTIGHRMIDFRRMHNINCSEVINPENTPKRAKLLELSVEARDQLRLKLLQYFQRKPTEDMI